MKGTLNVILPFISLLLFTFSQILIAQNSHLEFAADLWPEGSVVRYLKSNWDGTNRGYIAVYFKDKETIESLKWHEGHPQATVVTARIDHRTFNVSYFKNLRCQDGQCRKLGEMSWDNKIRGYVLQFGEFTDTITNVPPYWHSYDFDFASLMTAFLFKKNTASHEFQRMDFQGNEEGLIFTDMGAIEMTYQKTAMINGANCNLYLIDGPGLQDQGGEIWFDQKTNLMKGYKIKLPDERSYNSVDLQFLGLEKMNVVEWEAYKQKKWDF